jgi:hypothetical protein
MKRAHGESSKKIGIGNPWSKLALAMSAQQAPKRRIGL